MRSGPGPYHRTNDPRTPNSYELVAFIELVLALVSEETMLLKPGASVESALSELKSALAKLAPAGESRPIFLKHPAAALIIPQICQVFDTKLIYVLRAMKDIEATRQRRNWAVGSTQAARIIYSHMFDHLVIRWTPTAIVRYAELIEAL